ncbi:MAG: flavodoxin family protein [Spirochaetota bacterium]
MKVVAFNGSPHKDGNTSILINTVFKSLKKHGITCETIQVGGKLISGCTACLKCKTNKDKKCTVTNDMLNDWIAKMLEAEGIIIASPTYFADLTSETKALIDRAGYVAKANGNMFKRKVGAAVVAVRRAGAIHVFDSINHFFLISEMIVPGSFYWNLGIGRKPGEVENDREGMETMECLGENMAWLLKKLYPFKGAEQ